MSITSDLLGKLAVVHRPMQQAHLELPEVLNLKPVLGDVEVTALHLYLSVSKSLESGPKLAIYSLLCLTSECLYCASTKGY